MGYFCKEVGNFAWKVGPIHFIQISETLCNYLFYIYSTEPTRQTTESRIDGVLGENVLISFFDLAASSTPDETVLEFYSSPVGSGERNRDHPKVLIAFYILLQAVSRDTWNCFAGRWSGQCRGFNPTTPSLGSRYASYGEIRHPPPAACACTTIRQRIGQR